MQKLPSKPRGVYVRRLESRDRNVAEAMVSSAMSGRAMRPSAAALVKRLHHAYTGQVHAVSDSHQEQSGVRRQPRSSPALEAEG